MMRTKFVTITDTFIGMIDGAMKFRIQFFTDDYLSYFEIELSPIGVACLAKILEVVGVKQWEHLRGSRMKIKDEGFGSEITSICNLSGAEWFDIREFLEGETKTPSKNENTCVCCGYPIPEGRHVCNTCALNGVDVDAQRDAWLKSFEGSPLPLKYEHTGKSIAKILSIDTEKGTMVIEPYPEG